MIQFLIAAKFLSVDSLFFNVVNKWATKSYEKSGKYLDPRKNKNRKEHLVEQSDVSKNSCSKYFRKADLLEAMLSSVGSWRHYTVVKIQLLGKDFKRWIYNNYWELEEYIIHLLSIVRLLTEKVLC